MRVLVAGKLVQRSWQDNDGFSALDRFLRTAISSGKDLRAVLNCGVAPFCRTASQPTPGGPTSFGLSKRQSVEIQVTHVGPDLQFQSGEVGFLTSPKEKQSAYQPVYARVCAINRLLVDAESHSRS